MNRIFRRKFFFLSISFLFFLFPLSSEALTVRVLLESGVSSATISAPHSIFLHDASGKKTTHAGAVRLSMSSARSVLVDGKTRALPVTLESSAPLMFGKTRFRGNIRISGAPDGLAVINVVDSETYLRGVLKMEANPAWPNEALKAQAIVSRTYALRRISGSNGREYDVSDSIESQVYRGVNAEDPRCDAAIRSTQGIVLSYGGSIAFTPFHSDSGGNTADIRDVWGGSYPYLSGLKEPVSYTSPNSVWKRQLSASEIESILLRLKKSVGRISNVSVQAADSAGRAVTLLFSGSGGRVSVKAHDFRMAAGPSVIKSTLFTITPNGSPAVASAAPTSKPRPEEIAGSRQTSAKPRSIPLSTTPMSFREEQALMTLTEQGAFSTEELLDMLKRPETRKGYLIEAINRSKDSNKPRGVLPTEPNSGSGGGQSFLFTGKGWGHGVGMSQWGAKAMAEAGWSHKEILRHYYPGTELTRR